MGDPRRSVGGSFLDYAGDGRLDLSVANYVEFDYSSRYTERRGRSAADPR